jgi:hypothetical protein
MDVVKKLIALALLAAFAVTMGLGCGGEPTKSTGGGTKATGGTGK